MHDHAKPSKQPAAQPAPRSGPAPLDATSRSSSSALRLMQMQSAMGNQAAVKMMSKYLIQRNAPPPPPPPLPPTHGDARLPDPLPPSKKVMMQSMLGAHLRDFSKVPSASGAGDEYKVNEAAQIGGKIKYKTVIEMYSEIKDPTGAWVLAKFGGKLGFVRENKVVRGLARARDVMDKNVQQPGSQKQTVAALLGAHTEESSAFDDGAETAGNVLEMLHSGPGGVSESFDERIDELEEAKDESGLKDKLELDKAGVDMAADPLSFASSAVTGIMGMKKTIDALRDPSKDKDEKFFEAGEGILDAAEGLQGGVESSASFADGVDKLAGTKKVEDAGVVSDWAGSVGDSIAAIKSAFFVVKDIYDVYKKVVSPEGISKDEALSAGLSIIGNSLQAAQSAVKTVKSILDILKVGAAGLGQAIPGIGIAISGIQITIKVYNMIKSSIAAIKMTKVKRKFKEDYKSKDYVGKKERKLFGKTLFSSFNAGTDKTKLEARKAALATSTDAAEQQELKDIQEYELAKEMKAINLKRIARGSIQVGLEMVNIAGDIATLSGVGAQVGVPLKAVAAGASVTMSVARTVKQAGRDRAAKPTAWKLTKMVFDGNKSTTAKTAKREKDATLILQMIADLPEFELGDDRIVQQYKRVEDFISASGINPKELYRLNGKPAEQRKLLMGGMKKRE